MRNLLLPESEMKTEFMKKLFATDNDVIRI